MLTHTVPNYKAPLFVNPLADGSYGWNMRASFASAAWGASFRANFVPIVIPSTTTIARWFWLNGATVGTNLVQEGLYVDGDAGPVEAFALSPFALSAGTANLCQFVNPGVSGGLVISGNSTTDGTTFTTASVTLKAGTLYLLSVTNSKASAADVISSIDNGPTFTSRSSIAWDVSTAHRTSIWSVVPTVDYTGTLVINFGANTQTGAVWSLSAHMGVDTATNDGIVQNATGSGNSATALATLAAFGSANNATFGAFGGAASAPVFTPEAGYLELDDSGYVTPTTTQATVFRPDNDTTVTETLTSGQWGAAAVEIKSLGTGPIVVPPGRYWIAHWCNGTTATFFRSAPSTTFSRDRLGYFQNTVIGLPRIAGPFAAGGGAIIPMSGFTTIASP